MFFTLLTVTFVIACAMSFGVARVFRQPIGDILRRIIKDDVSGAWQKYISFATYVVGISGGVRIYQLEQYVNPALRGPQAVEILELTAERWTIEVYRTVIGTLQSIAWMYLVVFLFALIAYVIVRGFEWKRGISGDSEKDKLAD